MTGNIPPAVVAQIREGTHPVQALRAWKGLSLGALANSAGLGPDVLTEIEEGREATAGETDAIAGALGVKPRDLVNRQDDGSEIGDDEIPW